MLVLGLLILVALGVGAVEFVLANRQPVVLHMWNWTWHTSAFWLAVMGAVALMLAWIALGSMRLGFAYERRVRRERRELAAENARLTARARSADTPRPDTRGSSLTAPSTASLRAEDGAVAGR